MERPRTPPGAIMEQAFKDLSHTIHDDDDIY
jgi:hypothetical protein